MARTKDVPMSFTYFIGEREVTELPPDYLDRMSARLSVSMSDYYSRHPDEYKVLLGSTSEKRREKSEEVEGRRENGAKGSDIRGAGEASS